MGIAIDSRKKCTTARIHYFYSLISHRFDELKETYVDPLDYAQYNYAGCVDSINQIINTTLDF